jgi:hypothetical protein
MPSRSRSRSSKQNKRKCAQKGGSDGTPQVPQISEATLKQAGEIAQKLLGQSMQQGNNNAQTGGSASGAAPQSGASSSSASAPVQNAMVGGAVAGAVAGAAVAEAAETKSALNMSPLVGGGRKRKRQSKKDSESQSQSQSQNQTGGMVPGLMAAVETALVPLGLYLGQKALQSRRSGKSFARSFNSRKFSRRNRSSRRR